MLSSVQAVDGLVHVMARCESWRCEDAVSRHRKGKDMLLHATSCCCDLLACLLRSLASKVTFSHHLGPISLQTYTIVHRADSFCSTIQMYSR